MASRGDDTKQRPSATPAHTCFLRTDHAGDDIDSGDQCVCIVAQAATEPPLPLQLAKGPGAEATLPAEAAADVTPASSEQRRA